MRKLFILLAVLTLAAPLMFYGCSGDDGSNGAPGATGPTGPTGPAGAPAVAKPETCAVCHAGAGTAHQASYDQLYQDGVIQVTNVNVQYTAPNVVTTTFNMTKAGANFDCRQSDSLGIYFVAYTDNSFQMDNGARLSLQPSATSAPYTGTTAKAYNGAGLCTVTGTFTDNLVDFTGGNGLVVVYGRDETLGSIPNSRVQLAKYPFAAVKVLGTVGYASAANVSGCEKCHTVPFLKHGYIYGKVNDNVATNFYTCKACHLDNGDGGHFIWQLLVDDTPTAAYVWDQEKANGGDDADYMTPEQIAKYAYQTRLMNDVHMSHAMEFEYPQSMSNCATCHAGKLNVLLTDNNFTLETCRSCHPVTGSEQAEKPQPALLDVMPPAIHGSLDLYDNATNCNGCHKVGGIGKTFSQIHTGYDTLIYTDNGVKYSSLIKVTIDNASFNDNGYILSFGFSATGSAGGLNANAITPTVLVGLYGYNTKDYIVGPHEGRQLEWTVGSAAHPRIQLVSSGSGRWVVQANLSDWAGIIDNGAVSRVEIAVMPSLQNPALPAGDNVVALDAPSMTYSLVANSPVNNYFEGTNAIVKVTAGCNNCHDALATTFHTPDRGGNIVVCRLCHITKSGASHLEMQSRSIDSYVHTIHSFQPFDYGRALDRDGTDFDNAVQVMFLDLAAESHYPTFGTSNCMSCHNAGKFNVPDQTKSLPGIFSAAWTTASNPTMPPSAVSNAPAWVAGPASRACGACHRAELIKAKLLEPQDAAVAAGELATFNQHTEDGGYLLTPAEVSDLINAINALSPVFYDGILVTLP